MQYPVSKLNGLVGFAQAGKVTGGWDGQVVEITSLNDLTKYAADTTPRVLVISKNIVTKTLTKVFVGANKTFIGSFGEGTDSGKYPLKGHGYYEKHHTSEH